MNNRWSSKIRKADDVIFIIFIIQAFAVENHSSETRNWACRQPASSWPGPVSDNRIDESCNEGTVDDVRAELCSLCDSAGNDGGGGGGKNVLEEPIRVEIVKIFPALREKVFVADELVCCAWSWREIAVREGESTGPPDDGAF